MLLEPGTMWLIWVGVVLMILHFADIGPFGSLNWWWALPFGLAFVWFEVIERTFGLDRKKGFDEMDRAKRRRISKSLGDHGEAARKKQAKSRR